MHRRSGPLQMADRRAGEQPAHRVRDEVDVGEAVFLAEPPQECGQAGAALVDPADRVDGHLRGQHDGHISETLPPGVFPDLAVSDAGGCGEDRSATLEKMSAKGGERVAGGEARPAGAVGIRERCHGGTARYENDSIRHGVPSEDLRGQDRAERGCPDDGRSDRPCRLSARHPSSSRARTGG